MFDTIVPSSVVVHLGYCRIIYLTMTEANITMFGRLTCIKSVLNVIFEVPLLDTQQLIV